MASLVAIASERFRVIVLSSRRKLPSLVVILGIWIVAVCVVMPYGIYMSYIDVEEYFGHQLAGVAICYVSLVDDIASYIRGLFIALYALPLFVITYLHVKVGSEIRKRDEPSNIMVLGPRPHGESMVSRGSRISRGSRSSQGDVWTPQEGKTTSSGLLGEPDCSGEIRRHSSYLPPHHNSGPPKSLLERGRSPSLHPYEDTDFDLQREQRDQRYVASLIMSYALCLCPLMIVRLVKNMVMETHANSAHFDLTYITFVWVAFLPTVITPTIFGFWRMTRPTKERIQGYLKFSGQNYPIPPPDGSSRRCSSNPYGLGLPMHAPHTGMGGHRLSVEASLSVNTHLHPQTHSIGRPLTPTPSHSRGMGSIPNPNFGLQPGHMRPHSLSFS